MITQNGPQCDICGGYILPGIDRSINPFTIPGINGTLCCHDKCRPFVEDGTWDKLPDGPLRKAWEDSLNAHV